MDRQTYRVAIAVFVEVEGVSEHDAGTAGMLAIRQALCDGKLGSFPREVEYRAMDCQHTAKIVDVIEVGMAAGNGYLWTRPTSKAFRE
jgi:hypothetical protein